MKGNKNSYGVDVAKQRTDDLDKRMLEHVSGREGCRVLDLGCGAGGQSSRLAMKGASVVGFDIDDYEAEFDALRREYSLSKEQLYFEKGDIRELKEILKNRIFCNTLCQLLGSKEKTKWSWDSNIKTSAVYAEKLRTTSSTRARSVRCYMKKVCAAHSKDSARKVSRENIAWNP